MKLYSILFTLITLILAPQAFAKTNSQLEEIQKPLVINDEDVIETSENNEDVSEEINIIDSQEDYVNWLNEQESLNAETVYIDEDGNEYYIPEEDVASNNKTPHLKIKAKRSGGRNCAASSGRASWYGPGFNGRRTANGERFNQNALTAAHKTLRFGSIVRVTYKGRSVDVRINDAGPYVKGRVIDLSKAAAKKIGLIGAGSGNVTLEVISCG